MATATTTKKTPIKPTPKSSAKADAFGAADFAENAHDYFAEFVTKMTDASEDMREHAEDLAADMRERFEKNQKIAADLNADFVEAAKAEVADAVQFASDLGKAKTFADAMEVQQSYWSNFFETRVERTQAMTEKSVDAAKEAFAPVKTDFAAMFDASALEKFWRFPTKA